MLNRAASLINNHLTDINKTHRKDIDGLRAFAVISVLIGHFSSEYLPGGFLGVDIFFVISGYVITWSLLHRSSSSFFEYIFSFFARRIKRIIPALIVCILLTSFFISLVDPFPSESYFTGLSALFGLSNIYLYVKQLDYFSSSIAYNAFAHTWSLGVEEQFYLIFPFILFFVCKPNAISNVGIATLIIACITLASLVFFIIAHQLNHTFAYYLMPTRFWQLGLGVLLAIFIASGQLEKLSVFNTNVIAGLTGIKLHHVILLALIASMFIFQDKTLWGHVAVSVLTAALILNGAINDRRSFILTSLPMLFLGYISYSAYLWHWPLLVVGRLQPDSLMSNFAFYLIATFIIASISYFIIERPFMKIRGDESPIIWVFAFTCITIFCAASFILNIHQYKHRIRAAFNINELPIEAALTPAFLNLPGTELTFNPTCVVDNQDRPLKDDTFDNCTYPPSGVDKPTIWAMGDSHAGHLQGLFVNMHEEHGVGFHLIETPGLYFPLPRGKEFKSRDILFENAREQFKSGDTVLISRLLLTREGNPTVQSDLDDWLEDISKLAQQMEPQGVQLAIVGPPPIFSFADIRGCVPSNPLSCAIDRAFLSDLAEQVHAKIRALEAHHSNLKLIETFTVLCPEHWEKCAPFQNGKFTYRDKDHLSVYGAQKLLPLFLKTLVTDRK